MNDPTTIAEKQELVLVISCKCGMRVTLMVKPGEIVYVACPKCGQTLTAVVPMRRD